MRPKRVTLVLRAPISDVFEYECAAYRVTVSSGWQCDGRMRLFPFPISDGIDLWAMFVCSKCGRIGHERWRVLATPLPIQEEKDEEVQ